MTHSTYRQTGDIINVAAPADVKAGEIIQQGKLVGQIVTDAKSGQMVGWRIEGVINGNKAAADDMSQIGQDIYWDDTAKNFTVVVASNQLCGKNVSSAAATTTEVEIKLIP